MKNYSGDFFSGLTEDKPVKTFCLTFATLVSFVLPFFLYSIIWFEHFGSDNKRTLINRFASLGCWTAMEYFLVFISTYNVCSQKLDRFIIFKIA